MQGGVDGIRPNSPPVQRNAMPIRCSMSSASWVGRDPGGDRSDHQPGLVRRMTRGVKSDENGYLTGVRDVARVVVIPAPVYRAVDSASGDAYVLAHLGKRWTLP